MNPLQFPDVVNPSQAKRALATLLEQAFELAAASSKPGRVLRCEVPVDGVDALTWLEAQGDRSRGYWCDRERRFELAGVGTADVITAETLTDYDALFHHLHERIASVHAHLHYYGGMRFNLCAPPIEKWLPFGAYRFVLPRFEVFSRGDQTYLACNALAADDMRSVLNGILHKLDAMPFPGEPTDALMPAMLSRRDHPEQWEWHEAMEDVLGELKSGALEKVVLARESVFTFDEQVNPVALLRRLSETSTGCYRFCFQPMPGIAFVGVSPERLYKRQERYISSEAVAGTRPATGEPERDAALAEELMRSDKERREHRYVLEAIQRELSKRCHAVHADSEVTVLTLERFQHLYARVEGILDEFNTDAELLRSLHPTPAVGGVPLEKAFEIITNTEPFDRGWYAGPVGWVGQDSAEFAVAIRSALITGNAVSVYAGAGIVQGSTAPDEWAELENKITPYTSVIA